MVGWSNAKRPDKYVTKYYHRQQKIILNEKKKNVKKELIGIDGRPKRF